jgi:hypothetical protein
VNKKELATSLACLALLGTTGVGLGGWYNEHQRVADLESRLAVAQQQEKRSAVVRSISKQMEEIAYEQKEISDEQREEAIQQKRVADDMRHRSEVERQNALIAQEQAVASEKQAQEARQVAESERQMAEHQRIQAELSKRITDTLSYVALARSLGALSSTQAQVGNQELADLLAYSSYHFINRYRGDVYYPAIFQSLMTASESKRSWSKHNGPLMGLAYMSQTDDRIVTVSAYGEIMIHKKVGDQLQSETLFSDKAYDFRDVFIRDDEGIYAVSRSGHLVIIEQGVSRVVELPNLDLPMSITEMDDNNFLLIGDHGLALYERQRNMVVATRELDFRITASGRYNNMPLLFDDKGRQHQVKSINDFDTSDVPFKGRVTAFDSSKKSMQRVYGLSDGTIYLYNETGKVTKLEGHLSRISKLKFNGEKLYSSSYDGTVKMWNTGSAKIEPMTLISAGSWIMNFTFDGSKQYAWIGDQMGNLTEGLLSVPQMVEMIRKKLKRDFTTDEWNYYIGKNVPFESFLSAKGKEVTP